MPLGCRLAGFMRPAGRSCRSFAATSTTSWSPPPPNGNGHPTTPAKRRLGGLRVQAAWRLGAPTCRGIGTRSASAIWSSPKKKIRTEGWYEAIVVEAAGDMFTLRWRDYPRERRIVRHRLRLGLLYPGPQAGKQLKPQSAKHQSAAAKAEPALPTDWQDIDLNKLVLAKEDGPPRSWWEAIPVEKAGDTFKLRWRDYSTMSPISRDRFALALICPDAA